MYKDDKRQAIVNEIAKQRGIATREAESAVSHEQDAEDMRRHARKAAAQLKKLADREESKAKRHREAEAAAQRRVEQLEAKLNAYDKSPEAMTIEQRLAALEERFSTL